MSFRERQATRVATAPYKGQSLPVKDVSIRWLSKAGSGDTPGYGLRYFTVAPGGEIPIHNHPYHQTMFVLRGRLLVTAHDLETDRPVEERSVVADDFVFSPAMEAHSIRNLSDTEEAAFLCCIGNAVEK